ncbi:DUF2004 domain-containing protein [Cuniculiplasma divulgatum]|nr:DUF2004 domain-containing protein [Cuniculiplasma divulgatum]MCL4320295.1 cytochrome P450 [Candidatus Thermoplasmatota archaeon]
MISMYGREKMKKGVEISFQLNDSDQNQEIVKALGNLTGNHFLNNYVEKWSIFHVTLGDHVFFKVLYSGEKIGKLHPAIEKEIKEYFDDLSKNSQEDLMKEYKRAKEKGGFKEVEIKELKEEYDLWQDRLWDYI